MLPPDMSDQICYYTSFAFAGEIIYIIYKNWKWKGSDIVDRTIEKGKLEKQHKKRVERALSWYKSLPWPIDAYYFNKEIGKYLKEDKKEE